MKKSTQTLCLGVTLALVGLGLMIYYILFENNNLPWWGMIGIPMAIYGLSKAQDGIILKQTGG